MRFLVRLSILLSIFTSALYAATNQLTLLDPVQEQVIHGSRVVLQYGVFNNSAVSQRLTAKINTLVPGDRVGFYTKDKVISPKIFEQFKIDRSKVRVSPRRISVAPKKIRPFKVAVDLKKAVPGTYFGNLLIKQLPIKSNVVPDKKDEKDKDLAVKLNILFDQYTAFYLNKGKGSPFEPAEGQTPVKIECSVDKENKNLTLHVYNDTSYALRASARSSELSDKAYRIVTVLPYTEATRDIAVPMTDKLKTPFKLEFLLKNKEVSSVMCK